MQLFKKKYQMHYKALLSLGVPIVIGQVGNIILGFADTLMVGHHSVLELGAASFVNTMFALFLVFAMGFSYSVTPEVGSMFGRGEHEKIGPFMRNALAANGMLALILLAVLAVFYLCLPLMGQPEELLPLMLPYLLILIVSIPFMCVFNTFKQFFDAIGNTKTPMTVMVGGNVMNIVGNYVLIYGKCGLPELGLLGAGMSTLLSRIMMTVALCTIYLGVKRYRVYAHGLLHSKFSAAAFRHVNALSWPLALQMGMEAGAFSLVSVFVGWIGATALAAHQVMLTLSQVFYMVYYGLGAAVAVRTSYFNGRKDFAAAKVNAMAGFHIILWVACLASVPIFMLRHTVSYWFTDSADVAQLVAVTIFPLIAYQFGDGMQCCYSNAMRGVADVKPMMYISFFSYFIMSLPFSWLFGIHWGYGLPGIWWAFPISLICAGVLYYTFFQRKLRREAAAVGVEL